MSTSRRGRSLAFLTAASLVLSLIFISSADNLSSKEPLPPGMEEIMCSPEYAHSWWGAIVLDLDEDQTLLAINPDRMFVPASTTKLFTVAAALDMLGADYRFETPVYARGKIDSGGRLKGDLILVASGDLTMGGRTKEDGEIAYTKGDHSYANYGGHDELTSADPAAGLKDLARQVLESGIKEIEGDVMVDDRLFTTYRPPMQSELDQYIISPIIINDNLIDLEVIPGELGERFIELAAQDRGLQCHLQRHDLRGQ